MKRSELYQIIGCLFVSGEKNLAECLSATKKYVTIKDNIWRDDEDNLLVKEGDLVEWIKFGNKPIKGIVEELDSNVVYLKDENGKLHIIEGALKKKFNYKPSDFKILKGKKTQDPRIVYTYKSKDGVVNANFFWEPNSVELRGVVGDTGILHVMFPMINKNGHGIIPSEIKILKVLIKKLNKGLYQE